ncbi:MAG: hypothetical protein ABIU05_22560 [Nitrospirales bacterium]
MKRALMAPDPGVAWDAYSGTKNEDPDIREIIRALDGLIEAQIIRQRPVRPYDEVDDLAASIAFSKLPSTD